MRVAPCLLLWMSVVSWLYVYRRETFLSQILQYFVHYGVMLGAKIEVFGNKSK